MQVLKGPKKDVRGLAFSPAGAFLAASSWGSLHLWNLSTGEAKRIGSFAVTPKSLSWTPDGQRVIWSYCSAVGTACWTTTAGETVELRDAVRDAGAACLSPDGRILYAAGDAAIRRFDVATGKKLSPWKTKSPGFLAVSPDGKTLASTHPLSPLAKVVHHVALWDTKTGKQKGRLLECAEFYDGVAFSPDGTRLAALGHQSLWLWEFPSGRVVAHHPSKKFYTGLAYSPDGRILATSNNDGLVRFWDGKTGEEVRVFDWKLGKALCVAFSRDGTRAAAGGSQGAIVIWDVD